MVNVDTVYQTVQALANKEQRGYITAQEFNLFANQAQQDIYEQYFYDLNAFRAERPQQFLIGDSVSHIMNKIRDWYRVEPLDAGGFIQSANLDGVIGKLFYDYGSLTKELKEVSGMDQIKNLMGSRWHSTSSNETFYFREGDRKIQAWEKVPNGALEEISDYTKISIEVILGRPSLVFWGYVVVNENATYNPAASSHFDLHNSEQADLVIKILSLAGISTEDPQLYQAAATAEGQNIQQENK